MNISIGCSSNMWMCLIISSLNKEKLKYLSNRIYSFMSADNNIKHFTKHTEMLHNYFGKNWRGWKFKLCKFQNSICINHQN